MRIAYILDTYPSPSETFIAREIAALRRRGFEITVFAVRAGEGAQPLRLPPGRVLRRFAAREYYRRAGARWAHSWNTRFDHIHAGWASYPALLAWGAAQASGLPWSFSGHARDLFVDGAQWPEKLQSARFVAVCTRAGQRFLQRAAPAFADRVLYAPHGLELEQFPLHERSAPHERTLRVLGVGRLVEKKGFDLLLQAVALLRAREYSITLTIIGEGPWRARLEKLRDRLRLSECVALPGTAPLAGVLAAMRAADVFALPCRVARDGDRDGVPNVLLEAAACGLPVVAARAGGVNESLDEATGRLCAPDDAAALADAIRAVWHEAEETQRRCVAARARVERDFDIERNIETLAHAFRANGA